MPLLKDKITLFSGNSGVGKSTMLNFIVPGAELRTAEISDAHNTGMHTTTFSEMLPLTDGGWVIDTPGIKGFGLSIWSLRRFVDISRRYSSFQRAAASTTALIPTSRAVPFARL